MPVPPFEKPEPPVRRGGSWLSIFMAIAACMGGYLVLSFLTLGFFGPVLFVVGGLFLIVLLHYFVWGWWLGKVIRQASDDEEEDPANR